MTLPRKPDAAPELTTTSTGGSRRAWLFALGVLVVLGGFIYVGLSGPAAPLGTPKPGPSAAAAIAIATPSPAPTPNLNEVTSIRVDPAAPRLYQFLGTGLVFNGQGTLAVLDPVGPLEYRGIYRVPYALVPPMARLEFDAVTASVSNDDVEHIGSWDFSINLIGPGGVPIILLDTTEPPQDKLLSTPEFSRLTANGYRLTVTMQSEADAALMTIDVTVNPDESVPDQFAPADEYPSPIR